MLVLSRKLHEQILIGDDIVVTIVEIRGNRVRLGFSAPLEVGVHRQEVHARLQAEAEAAADRDDAAQAAGGGAA